MSGKSTKHKGKDFNLFQVAYSHIIIFLNQLMWIHLQPCNTGALWGTIVSIAYRLTYCIHEVRQLLGKPAAHDINHWAEALYTQTIDFFTLFKKVKEVSLYNVIKNLLSSSCFETI